MRLYLITLCVGILLVYYGSQPDVVTIHKRAPAACPPPAKIYCMDNESDQCRYVVDHWMDENLQRYVRSRI